MYLYLATLNDVSFYLLHNVSTLNQCRKFSCVTVVCKHFTSYQDYPNYRWDLIRVIKARKMRWVGHVPYMGEGRGEYRVVVGKPGGKRPLGRPKCRWENINP
jgi:hypothetical protein